MTEPGLPQVLVVDDEPGIRQEIASLGPEKQKLSRWLRESELTAQAARFVNAQIDELCEQETQLQEQQWTLEDQINELQKENYNAQTIAGQLMEFVQSFPRLQAGERKLLVDTLIELVEIGPNKKVVGSLRPPLPSFGYFSTSLAPRGIEPRDRFTILITYSLDRFPQTQLPWKNRDQTRFLRRFGQDLACRLARTIARGIVLNYVHD